MWGYLGPVANAPTLEILVYAPDRPSCEFSRAMAQTRAGLPVPSQTAAQCEQLAILPYREGGDPVRAGYPPGLAEVGIDHADEIDAPELGQRENVVLPHVAGSDDRAADPRLDRVRHRMRSSISASLPAPDARRFVRATIPSREVSMNAIIWATRG